MNCPKCNAEIPSDATSCPNCNVKIIVSTKQEEPAKNKMSVAGFILAFFLPILGIIFSAIGLNRSFKRSGKGRGLAIAGLVIGILRQIARINQMG